VHGRWWVEGEELILALGTGDIRAPYSVTSSILYWADEVLVRRPMGKHRSTSGAISAAPLGPDAELGTLTQLPALLAD
jgi:hypothetical protein